MEKVDLSARYGYKHNLTHLFDNCYQLNIDPNSSGYYRLIGFENEPIKNKVYAIDPDGGPFIHVGMNLNGKIVKSITSNGIIEFENEN